MKVFRIISIILINAVVFGFIGFIVGFTANDYFYPGRRNQSNLQTDVVLLPTADPGKNDTAEGVLTDEAKAYGVSLAVAANEETLCVDTKYVVKEIDLNAGRIEENTYKLPKQYVGMNRDQYIEAMNVYQSSPPLSEIERGFEHLEVTSFSRERVVVEMCYRYVQPTECYYIAAFDNKVVVYLDDKKTIYIETGIPLDSLSEDLRTRVIDMYCVEDESILYDILENYTS